MRLAVLVATRPRASAARPLDRLGQRRREVRPGPESVRPRVRPAAARVPAKPPFRRKRDDLFYGPLVWKPLTHEECDREEMRRTDIFSSDGSDAE